MSEKTPAFVDLWKRPSAYLPIVMSVVAFATVLIHVAVYGAAREADEGAAAHLWQLLMAGQVPVLLFFLARWVRASRPQALKVVALQAGAAMANFGLVFYLGL